MEFKDLMLKEDLVRVVAELKFETPTYIQAKTIPLIMEGNDIIAQSETGSGKTAAFALPIIEKINRGAGIQALILTPTRELAEQISGQFFKFTKYRKLSTIAVYGGVAIGPQISMLKRTDVVVATPGRLLDHMERRTIDLTKITIVVLDEADKMFDMGFIDDVKMIISRLPAKRQTLLFSATVSREILDIGRSYMKNPMTIKGETLVDKSLLIQKYYEVRSREKFSLLHHFIVNEKPSLAIVFCATRQKTDAIARNLQKNNVEAMAIHGGHSQSRRNSIIKGFHTGRIHILVATDVAARGLDIKNVSHIFNYDIPKTSDEYIHRIGRTARAGKAGVAISLLSEADHQNFRNILNDRSLEIKREATPVFKSVPFMIQQNRFEGNNRNRFSRNPRQFTRNRLNPLKFPKL